MRRSTMPQAALALAALGLALPVAGCGRRAEATATAFDTPPAGAPAAATSKAPAGDPDSADVKAENMIADCMKSKGFRYVPHPLNFDSGEQISRYAGMLYVLEPADQVRAFRAKYGFGGYSKLVYPNDPAVTVRAPDPSQNPNNGIRDALDPAQQKAYDKALNGDGAGGKMGDKAPKGTDMGCGGEASLKYYGSGPSENEQAANRREYAKFANDPAVVKAAQKYGDCLKAKGYRVKRAQPGWVEQEMFTTWSDKAADAGSVSASAAQAGLTKEIKAALDDLDCGAEYATIARTRYAKAVRAGGGVG